MPAKNSLANLSHTVWASITAHKIISTVVAIVLIYGGYKGYAALHAPSTATRYVTTTVATGTVVSSVSETGQVSASSDIDVQAKSSGAVLSLAVTAGQHVSAGAPLAYIDPTTARQSLTSAQEALQSAQISLASAEGTVSQTRATSYGDMSTAFLNLPSVISGLDSILHNSAIAGHGAESNLNAYTNMAKAFDPSIAPLATLAESAYQKADISYIQALANFKATSRTADSDSVDATLKESAGAVADISDALRAATNFLDSVNRAFTSQDMTPPTNLSGQMSTLVTYTGTVNGYLASLANDVSSLTSDNSVGTDPLAIQSSKLSLQMKQDALAQAQQALADTVVRAPFSGVVGKIDVQQYQTISSGAAVATLVSDNQSVAISVNEVDAAKIKVGQKATITFDALSDVSIAGTVSSVNAVGTVSSGVVSYAAVVTFDTPNASVKPGMSATADIITGTETGLVVPQSAIKTSNGQSYVLTFDHALAGSESGTGATSPVAPTRTTVTTGLSDDSNTIVRDGLVAGAQVVTQTVTSTSATAASTAAQSTSVFGGSRTGGGNATFGGGGATRALAP